MLQYIKIKDMQELKSCVYADIAEMRMHEKCADAVEHVCCDYGNRSVGADGDCVGSAEEGSPATPGNT